MHGDIAELMSLKERLGSRWAEQPGIGRRENEAAAPSEEERPGTVLDTRSHAADMHNRRRGFESVRIHYGEGASVSLPYISMGPIDAPAPGKLVLEHSNRTVTITGVRLDALHRLLEQRQIEAVGVTTDPREDDAYAVEAIRVEKP